MVQDIAYCCYGFLADRHDAGNGLGDVFEVHFTTLCKCTCLCKLQ